MEEELKLESDKCSRYIVEIEHMKSMQEQVRILKEIKETKKEDIGTYPAGHQGFVDKVNFLEEEMESKQAEIGKLKSEVLQRDSLLEKARNLVVTLNQECIKKTEALQNLEIKELHKFDVVTPQIILENEKLKESINYLKNRMTDLELNSTQKESLASKTESFNLGADHSASATPIKRQGIFTDNQIENDISYLEQELAQVTIKLNDISSENTKLNECIRSLELKYCETQQEKIEASNNLIRAYETIENIRQQKNTLEIRLKKYDDGANFNKSIEDLSKLLLQKESTISELTSQVLMKTHKHKKHRHNSYTRDSYELIEAVKKEIIREKELSADLPKETLQIFKDFQIWHKAYLQKAKFENYEELLVFLQDCFRGRMKEEVRNLLENLNSLDYESISKQVLAYVKSACSGKQEISTTMKDLNSNLNISIDSIELVTNKLQDIKRKVPQESSTEFCLKVIDLTLGFLKNFKKEREFDFELSCKIIKFINI